MGGGTIEGKTSLIWLVGFVEGVPAISMVLNDDPGKDDRPQDYSWTLPASVFIAYLKSLGRAASDQLVSQQRGRYVAILAQSSSATAAEGNGIMHVRHVANRIAANTQNAIRKRAVARAFSKENLR